MESLFEADSDYPDLDTSLAAKRYVRLISSSDYRNERFIHDDPDRQEIPSPHNNFPLPPNISTIGRRVTPALRIKILRAWEVFPTKGSIRVYELFLQVKSFGFSYNYKKKVWEWRSI